MTLVLLCRRSARVGPKSTALGSDRASSLEAVYGPPPKYSAYSVVRVAPGASDDVCETDVTGDADPAAAHMRMGTDTANPTPRRVLAAAKSLIAERVNALAAVETIFDHSPSSDHATAVTPAIELGRPTPSPPVRSASDRPPDRRIPTTWQQMSALDELIDASSGPVGAGSPRAAELNYAAKALAGDFTPVRASSAQGARRPRGVRPKRVLSRDVSPQTARKRPPLSPSRAQPDARGAASGSSNDEAAMASSASESASDGRRVPLDRARGRASRAHVATSASDRASRAHVATSTSGSSSISSPTGPNGETAGAWTRGADATIEDEAAYAQALMSAGYVQTEPSVWRHTRGADIRPGALLVDHRVIAKPGSPARAEAAMATSPFRSPKHGHPGSPPRREGSGVRMGAGAGAGASANATSPPRREGSGTSVGTGPGSPPRREGSGARMGAGAGASANATSPPRREGSGTSVGTGPGSPPRREGSGVRMGAGAGAGAGASANANARSPPRREGSGTSVGAGPGSPPRREGSGVRMGAGAGASASATKARRREAPGTAASPLRREPSGPSTRGASRGHRRPGFR